MGSCEQARSLDLGWGMGDIVLETLNASKNGETSHGGRGTRERLRQVAARREPMGGGRGCRRRGPGTWRVHGVGVGEQGPSCSGPVGAAVSEDPEESILE